MLVALEQIQVTYPKPSLRLIRVNQKLEKADPTRTTFLRNAFEAQMEKRFRALRGLIRKAVVDQDCFGIADKEFKVTMLSDFSLPGRRAFAFTRSQEKVVAFMEWLQRQEAQGILQTGLYQQIGSSIDNWTNKYITDSYQRGVQRARYELDKAGYKVPSLADSGGIEAIMGAPMHIERVGVLYSRVFEELKGITATMDTQISRVLSQGLVDGKNPLELARLLTRTISGPMGDLGITDTLGRFIPAERRARMLARTEIIRAHHFGNIQEMENWAVEGVRVMAEWATGGNPCPDCARLQGKVFPLSEIRNMIPYHPNCKCCAIPMPIEGEKVKESKVKAPVPGGKQKPFSGDLGYVDSNSPSEFRRQMRERYGTNIGGAYQGLMGESKMYWANLTGDCIGNEILSSFPQLAGAHVKRGARAVLKEIHFANMLAPESPNWLASYFPSLKRITMWDHSLNIHKMVRKTPALSIGTWKHNVGLDFKSVLRHEYGHHVYEKVLNASQVKKVRELFTMLGQDKVKGMVSKYAATNYKEFFAEIFAAYTSPLYGTASPAGGRTLAPVIEDLLKEIIGARKVI